ncbi:MAG TPA: branched-chain amino acid ABC transporter permease [Thermoplasmata archaeon]|nr:branched-chain amino acid ABC transporter permease [Thermoplasmata archaeon]
MTDLRTAWFRPAWRKLKALGPTAQALAVALVALAALGPILPVALFVIAILFMIYATWAYSINLITGMTGYVSFGHVVFVGTGGYALGYGVKVWNLAPLAGVALGGLLGALLALGIGAVTLRLRGAYFAIATLVTPLAAFYIVSGTPALGDGAGLPMNLGFQIGTQYYTIWALLTAEVALTWWATRGRLGLGIHALREDEDAARAVGIHVPRLKLILYVLSGGFAGAAGAVFAWYVSGVFPDTFSLLFSLTMLAMIIIGGMGTVLGPMLGAVIVLIPHLYLLRILPQGEPIAIGVAVILIALFLPGGIVGTIRRYVPEARRYLE